MKILGFIFGERPSVCYHIDYLAIKFNNSIWSLVHLKRANINNNMLLNVYLVMLRPLLEYCHVIYHSMLSKEMSDRLESLQRKALRIIYGFGIPYEELLAIANVSTLQERRNEASIQFANKLVQSERFKRYFPINNCDGVETRRRRKYLEENCRTSRLYNSPLFFLRRLLNQSYDDEEDENVLDIFTT